MASRASPRHQRPVVEALEPKLLYSADLGLSAFVPDAAHATQAVLHQTFTTQTSGADLNHTASQAGAELVFVDASVPDLGALLQDMQQQGAQGRAIEVIVIRSDEDGLSRITETLQSRHDLGAVHLIGHGEAGEMQLGTTRLDSLSLMQRAGDIAQWGTALGNDGDLLLYGCDVAAGASGQALVANLATLTGADVAASDDLTGASRLGGDWQLEVQAGRIEAASAIGTAAQAQWGGTLALATPSTKGTAVWAEAGFTAPQQGSWDGASLGTQSDTAVSSTWTIVASAESPTRNEAIVVGVDAAGIVRGQRWDGAQWQALPMDPIATGSLDYRQGFAIAYEQQSGDAMLLWNDGIDLRYSVFNGTSWSSSKAVDAYDGAAPQRMQIAAQADGDSMVLVVSDGLADDYALIWNGSTWGHAITLDTSGTTYYDQISSAVAYEGLSGKAMVAYAKAGNANVYYRTFDGSSWSNEAAAGSYAESATPLWLTLASDPGSNRIGMGLLSAGASNSNQVSFSIWNGSSWGSRTIPATYTDTTVGSPVAVAFESRSGDLLAVYGTNSSNTRYLTWNSSSGWSSAANGPNASHPGSLRLFADPYTDHIMLGVQAEDGTLSFTDWTGSAFGSVNNVATDTGGKLTPTFTWLWANDMSGNKTNTLLLGGSAASTGWSGINSVGTGEILEFADPGLSYGSGGTSGTFSHVLDLAALGASGLDDIVWVSRDVTLTSGLVVHRGDVLFTTTAASTLVNGNGSTLSVSNNDVILYRPTVAGQYDKGQFTMLVQGLASGLLGLGSPNIRGLALVEQNTVFGDVTLGAGTLLFTAGTTSAAADILRFIPGSGGLLGGLLTGDVSTLIVGSEVGIGQAITGLEFVSTATPLKNVTLPAASLLISLEQSDTIASNNLSLTQADVAILTPTRTSVNSTAVATASLLMRGSSVGASGKVFDTLALSLDAAPVITSQGGSLFASVSISENSSTVTTVTATDADTDTTLSYSISGGADASLFSINASTGALRFIATPDYEQPTDSNHDNLYQVAVVASDGTYTDTQVITVTVGNVNEAPVITSDGGGTSSVITLTEGGTAVTQVQATDQDAGDTRLYTVTGTDASLFNIDPATGVLSFKATTDFLAPLDSDGDNLYIIQVNAIDTDDLADTQQLLIRVLQAAAPPNATPVIDSDGGGSTAALSINEDSTAVTTVHATDADSTTLTYSITGGADQALFNIDPLTGALSFRTAPTAAQPGDTDQDNVYEVSVSASDGATADAQDLRITVLAYNQPPANTLPASFDTSEDSALTLSGLSVSDADAGGASLTLRLSVQHGTLSVISNAIGGLGSGQISYSGDLRQVTLTGTAAAINATLSADQGVVYLADTHYHGTDTLTMLSDDLGQSGVPHSPAQTTDTDTATITIATVDDEPVLQGSGGNASYTENASATVINPGLTLSDIDTTTFTGATISITTNLASDQDVLGFTTQAGITGSWDAGTGVLTLSGAASASDYQAALRSVTYLNSADDPDTRTRTITFAISDGSNTVTVSRNLTLTAVNDAPMITAGGTALSYTENDAATAIDPALTLVDADHASLTNATVQITGHYIHGQDVLSFSDQLGLVGNWDASTGTLTLTGTASTTDLQTALRSVRYANTSNDPDTTTRTVTFSVNDGSGAVTTTQTITLTAVNDAPVITAGSTPLAYTENDAATAIDPGLTLGDIDTTSFTSATVQITGHYISGQDVLSFSNQLGLTGNWDAGTGTLTLTGTTSIADLQTALRSVRYTNTSNDPDTATRTVTFSINDGSGAVTTTQTITLNAVNDAPVITAGSTALAYTENDAATAIDPGLTLGDVDTTSFTNATVQITGHYIHGQDVLSFSNQLGLTGNWDESTGALTLTGTASITDLQTALRSVRYANTSNDPDTATRTVTFSINDGSGAVTATQTITLTAINDAPTLLVNSLSIQQGGSATPTIQAQDSDTAQASLTLTADNIIGGHFVDTRSQAIVTQFSYADVQAGHIQFVHDNSNTTPGYELVLGDGSATTAAASATIAFTLTPPEPEPAPPQQPPPPPPPPTESPPETPPAEPTQASAEPATVMSAPVSPAAAPLIMAAFVPDTLRAAPLVLDGNPGFTPARPVADTPVRNNSSGEVSAVVAEAFQFSWAGDLQTTTNPEELRRNLDALRDQLQEQGTERRHVVASSIALTTGLSVGYVIWLVRGGALLGSMLSAMPAWQMIDPLPVLTRGRQNAKQLQDGDDDASVEHLFDGDGEPDFDDAEPDTPAQPSNTSNSLKLSTETHP